MNTLQAFVNENFKPEKDTIMNYLYLKWGGTWIGGALFAAAGVRGAAEFLANYAGKMWVFFASLENLIMTIFWLMIADWITGMIASYSKGIKIESRKMSRTSIKLLMAVIAIYAPHLVTVKLQLPINLAFFPAGVIIVTELRSLLENASAVLGYDVVSRTMAALKGFLKSNQTTK